MTMTAVSDNTPAVLGVRGAAVCSSGCSFNTSEPRPKVFTTFGLQEETLDAELLHQKGLFDLRRGGVMM